jgi:methylmalonyl-CoA/ethylmalonyl-CoA epimerase
MMELSTGKMFSIIVNTRQKVRVVFLKKCGSIQIKLIEPVGQDSPIYQFARKGGGLHHLCFKCGDITTQINILKEKGLRVLSPPQLGEAFEDDEIAFVFAKHGLNVELIDTNKRAKIIKNNNK